MTVVVATHVTPEEDRRIFVYTGFADAGEAYKWINGRSDRNVRFNYEIVTAQTADIATGDIVRG
jgi:hypothetical protein